MSTHAHSCIHCGKIWRCIHPGGDSDKCLSTRCQLCYALDMALRAAVVQGDEAAGEAIDAIIRNRERNT